MELIDILCTDWPGMLAVLSCVSFVILSCVCCTAGMVHVTG